MELLGGISGEVRLQTCLDCVKWVEGEVDGKAGKGACLDGVRGCGMVEERDGRVGTASRAMLRAAGVPLRRG